MTLSILLQPSRRVLGATLTLVLAAALPVHAASFSTITINDTRQFNLTSRTLISLDGQPITPSALGALGGGFNTRLTLSNANATLSTGDAESLRLENLVKGPVTALQPLSVLGQPIVVNGDTLLSDLPAGGVAALHVGDLVEISGIADANGSIVASRLHGGLDPLADWKLSGTVAGLAGSLLHIGAQNVDIGSVVPQNCSPALADGQYVEIETLSSATFTAGATLAGVIAVACEDRGFDHPPGGEHSASLEGVVDAVPEPATSPFSFAMGSVTVVVGAATQWHGGSVDDIDAGVRVEVEGSLDADTSIFTALDVRFIQPEVRFTNTVQPADVVPGQGMTMLGNAIVFNAQTRDDDGIAANGLTSARQVEVRAYVDSDGNLFATRVRRRNGGGGTLQLNGPVASFGGTEIVILGITVDTASASFRDADNQPLTAAAFFAQLQNGRLVKSSGGSFNAATHRLTPSQVEFEDDAPGHARPAAIEAVVNGLSRGTTTGVAVDQLFGASFD